MPQAILFGGSADSLNRTTDPPVVTAFTVMAWLNLTTLPSALGHSGGIFSMGLSASHYALYVDVTANHLAIWNASTGNVGATALVAGRWYHVAFTVSGTSGTNALSYLDGVADVTHTATAVTSAELNLANDQGGTSWLAGRLAAIKCWNKVLTLAEIVAELPYAMPQQRAGINSAYPLPTETEGLALTRNSRAAGTLFPSLSGNGEWTTVNGAPLLAVGGPPIAFDTSANLWMPRRFVPAAAGAFLPIWAAHSNQLISGGMGV